MPREVRDLIRTMLKVGIDVSQATVAKYMIRHRRPPSQTWKTFLANQIFVRREATTDEEFSVGTGLNFYHSEVSTNRFHPSRILSKSRGQGNLSHRC